MSSTMQSRKEEILAKKARLAELKRQRELRQEQFAQRDRHSIGSAGGEVRMYCLRWSGLHLTNSSRRREEPQKTGEWR